MLERDRIEGKVAKVLNSRQLALNVGAKAGVCVGMIFEVLDPDGEKIVDPDTGEDLGIIERPKATVRVIQAEERLSVAETFKAKRVNTGGSGFGIGSIADRLMPPRYELRYETLKTDEQTWESVSENDCFVKSGDRVRQASEPEPER